MSDAPLSYNALVKLSKSELRELLKVAKRVGNWPAYHNIKLVLAEKGR